MRDIGWVGLDYVHRVDDDLGERFVTLDGAEVKQCTMACVSAGEVRFYDDQPVIVGDTIVEHYKTGVVTVTHIETGHTWSL